MTKTMLFGTLLVALAACGRGEEQLQFDGQVYRTDARAEERSNRQVFTATARPVSSSLEGAVLAAEHEGIKHCIQYYGTSDIDWQVGPDTAPEALPIDDDTLVLSGTCHDR